MRAAAVQADAGLEAIDPASEPVKVDGKVVDLRPMKIGQIPAFSRALAGIAANDLVALADGDGSSNLGALMALIGAHGDQIIKAAAIAARLDERVVANTDPDEFVLLVAGVMRVNADFFARRLAPLFSTLAAQAQALAARSGAGSTSSMSSSAPDTRSTPFSTSP